MPRLNSNQIHPELVRAVLQKGLYNANGAYQVRINGLRSSPDGSITEDPIVLTLLSDYFQLLRVRPD